MYRCNDDWNIDLNGGQKDALLRRANIYKISLIMDLSRANYLDQLIKLAKHKLPMCTYHTYFNTVMFILLRNISGPQRKGWEPLI